MTTVEIIRAAIEKGFKPAYDNPVTTFDYFGENISIDEALKRFKEFITK